MTRIGRPGIIIIILSIVYSVGLDSQTLRLDSLYAPSIGKTKSFVIILPSNAQTEVRYPVLYLLHGYGGSHLDWTTRTKIQDYVKDMPLIVVMPDAENSWYANSISDPQRRFEDYIVSDLPQYVVAHYNIDTTRQAIAGLSMGGYGAITLALRHPHLYLFAGSLSGALNVPTEIPVMEKQPWAKIIAPSLKKVLGDRPGLQWSHYDPFHLYRRTPKDSLPYLYFVTGIHDGFPTFLPMQRALTDSLRSYGARYEYHETPGGHNWQFWDWEIRPLLARMREIMKF